MHGRYFFHIIHCTFLHFISLFLLEKNLIGIVNNLLEKANSTHKTFNSYDQKLLIFSVHLI